MLSNNNIIRVTKKQATPAINIHRSQQEKNSSYMQPNKKSQNKKRRKSVKNQSTAIPGGRHSGTKIATFQKPENNHTKPKMEKN
jgi:ornithine cyclodeaminase/alanine dehydrogenase-like protein (mu-crystallin family)